MTWVGKSSAESTLNLHQVHNLANSLEGTRNTVDLCYTAFNLVYLLSLDQIYIYSINRENLVPGDKMERGPGG